MACAAWGGFMRAAEEIAGLGTFRAFADARPSAELNGFFREDALRRRGSV